MTTRSGIIVGRTLVGLAVVMAIGYMVDAEAAAVCKTKTPEGLDVFMFIPNAKTGQVVSAKSVSGTVATMKECKVAEIVVRKEVVETYVTPNPVNDCERQATLVCEPSFKGLPIGNVSNMNGYCGFMLVTTKVNGEDITKNYINGQVYDGSKYLGVENGTNGCPNPTFVPYKAE